MNLYKVMTGSPAVWIHLKMGGVIVTVSGFFAIIAFDAVCVKSPEILKCSQP